MLGVGLVSGFLSRSAGRSVAEMKKVASRAKVALAYASLILTHEWHLGNSAHSAHFPGAALVLFEKV